MQNQSPKLKSDVRERAYRYSIDVIQFIDGLPTDMTGSVITKQLVRCATSIGANLVESKGAGSKKEFAMFFSYSLRSANETLYWLGLLRDAKKVQHVRINELIGEAQEISRIIGASLLTMRGQR